MKSKLQKNTALFYFIPFGILNVLIFIVSYFAIKPLNWLMEFQFILLLNMLIAVGLSIRCKTTRVKMLLIIASTSIVSSFMGFILIFSTMFLPGSREHNYVMYQICLPVMKKHYGLDPNKAFPDTDEYDKRGFAKWWYQHAECEQNVWNGKGPIFTENPPGFNPVEKNSK